MTTETTHQHGSGRKPTVEIAGLDLAFRSFELDTETPTGGKIARVAGFDSAQRPYVLQWMHDGDFEGLRVLEEADLDKGARFIVAESDGTNRIAINGNELDWPADAVSGEVVRKLGRIPSERPIFLERVGEADRMVEDADIIKIAKGGIEEFKSREPQVWKLNVQGKRLESRTPTIAVVDALTRAGFDPNAWIIILKVEGQPKRQLAVGDVIDLRTPGIEKVRLTAKDVNNGESRPLPRRDFPLLEVDESFLDGLGLPWETKAVDGPRWLIIHDYPVPVGYTISTTTLALLVPPNYPQAQIDMFYAYPALAKAVGGVIPATKTTKPIDGLPFQRWSRHRGPGSPWNPQQDNVVTHLALVESAIAKEVDQ
ncbi:multiubiquitin domain-containing protein [Mesorhizobium sp. M1307]|uniref:multiubiquitin domain-containing protein n=1 Tax=Mesorhizobium sp. M1307 TaxID=2957079 RepID=UPI00333AD271